LEDTNYHTQKLETKGRLTISGTALKKFIGKTLLLKNRIAENLYVFDSPPETWENERIDKLYNDLKKNFDLTERFKSVSDGLAIVKDNLEFFKDILQLTVNNQLVTMGLNVFRRLCSKADHVLLAVLKVASGVRPCSIFVVST
jgi:required for meiotic nuclear division protein 1